MILQPIHGRLTPDNCTIILMDYQSQFALSINSTDGDILIRNGINIAKDHASAYGLEIQYERSGLDERQTRLANDKPRERWWPNALRFRSDH